MYAMFRSALSRFGMSGFGVSRSRTLIRHAGICTILALTAIPAHAALISYTSQSSWNTAAGLIGTITCDDIESDTLNPTHPSPYTTSGGWTFSQQGTLVNTISVYGSGIVNGTQEVHFRDFNGGVQVTLPAPALAGAFDFGLGFESWTIDFGGGSVFTLPNSTVGFFGFTSTTPVSSFLLTGATGPQGGIAMDNLCHVVPEPTSLGLVLIGGLAAAMRRR